MRWNGTTNLGMIVLGVWLILTGLLPFVQFNFAQMGSLLAILAVAAGSLILLGR